MRILLLIPVLSILLYGCASIPLRDGELVIDANTTAGIPDPGVASINRQF